MSHKSSITVYVYSHSPVTADDELDEEWNIWVEKW